MILRHAARELRKWPEYFLARDLQLNLFNLYLFIETGGTGGGCFRLEGRSVRQERPAQRANDAGRRTRATPPGHTGAGRGLGRRRSLDDRLRVIVVRTQE